MDKIELKWKPEASVCVVMASGGYPGSYAKGKPILGLAEAAQLPNTKVFHAGTALKDGQIVTNGGRVLGVTALGQGFEIRASGRLRGRWKNLFRRRPFPPRHRGEGVAINFTR